MRRTLVCLVFPLLLIVGCRQRSSVNASVPMTKTTIEVLMTAAGNYVSDCGVPFPTNAPLAALIDDPGIPGWAGPYIRRSLQGPVPLDAWGRDFRVQTDAALLVTITSAGRDGLFGTPDDIVGTKQCRLPTTGIRSSSEASADIQGLCPKCNTVVKGLLSFWDGHDDKGNPVSGACCRGTCPSCQATLTAPGDSTGTNVVWRESLTR